MKRIKFATEAHAAEMMGFALVDGFITAWQFSKAGYVRYHCARCQRWLDLNENTFRAWKYAY